MQTVLYTDQVLHTVASDQCIHCLPLILQILDAATGSTMEMFQF